MKTLKTANIINRHTAKKTVLTGEGNLSVAVSGASVIEILGSAQDVARYVRQGNDLLIYMKDGSVVRCSNYFTEDPESKLHSELVFSDETGLTHITFDDVANVAGLDAVELTAHATPIDSIEPLLAETANDDSEFPWAWLAGAALGGGAIGALLSSDGDDKTKTETVTETEVVDNTKNLPTYMVSDKKGNKQGVLTANETTDDNTPTFSGTGHPGATIQVKDSNGNTIASTMVDSNGKWTVLLPVQTDGTHTWSVVQINGQETTSAGSITVVVDTTKPVITLATTAGDNVINASEQAAGITLSGTTSHLAVGTNLTITLNGKMYITKVGANGEWKLHLPAADANALTDGSWTVTVTGQNAAGNTVSGSQVISVDTQPPLLSMDTIAIDQIINAAEHNALLVLSGKTTAEAGQTVTLMFNGKSYTATVAADGTWSLTLPAADVQAMADGNHSLTITVSDKAGNATSISEEVIVDTTAPVLTVNTVAGDNILNDEEQNIAQIISGMADGAAPGDVVTVQFGNQTFTGVVQADGSWSVGVPSSLFASMSNGQHIITVTVTDAAGNTSTATHDVTLNSVAVGITVDTISQDNILNAQEAMQPLTLSGTSTLADGSTVTVMLNNISYTATVNNGTWSVQVPVSDVLNLANTNYQVTVNGTDSVGNSGTATGSFLVDTTLPQVIINNFTGDNLVNNAETNSDQILSGRVTGAAAGDTISITVGGKNYTAIVESDLSWKVTIPASDLQSFGDGDLTFTASVTNSHGNTGTGDRDININASLPGLRINTLSGDDIVNAIEQQHDLVVTGSSSHLAAGTVVTVTINNVDYQTVIDNSGNWQIGVPVADLQNWTPGQLVVTANAEDNWHNTVSVDHAVELDLNPVAISIDTVAVDDIINAAEKGTDLILSGQTQGVEAGQTVVVKFAGQTFTAQVQSDGSWSVTVPSSAMSLLTDSREQIGVSVTNASGNAAEAGHSVTLDTSAPLITINAIATDDILNATESQVDLVISGTTTAPVGQTVTVTLNGNSYTALVQADGTWSVSVPPGSVYSIMAIAGVLTSGTVTATVSDVAGNTGSASHNLTIDTTLPVVTIDAVATDNIINTVEHGQTQIISGSATGAAAGDAVVVTINGKNYTTVVDAAGNWSIGLPATDVAALADGTTTISVTVTNAAGNSGSATHDVDVDTAAPTITINTVTADDVINAAEQGADLVLSGATTNVEAGQTVTVMFNGKAYTATVAANGEWTLTVPAADLAGLTDGNARVDASVSNTAGNAASATHDYSVDTSAPVITINTLAADDILNATEAQADLIISGTTTAPAGQTVTVTIGGVDYTAQVQANGSWSVTVPAADVASLATGAVTASVSDTAGNTGSASHNLTVDATVPVVTINTVALDDIINTLEHGQPQIISGSATGAAAGDAVVVTINGKNYTTVVDAAGNWSIGVPAADVAALADGTTTISVTVTNAAGNSGSATHDVDVDTAAPTITINTVTADDVINAAEQGADLVLSGATTNIEAGQTVSVMFNGKSYTATVAANGEWTLTVPAADLAGLTDGNARVDASVSNTAGNAASATHDYSVDTAAPAITINTLAADDILNATEAQADLVITGTTTAPAGQTVTVTIGGVDYTAQVQANGSWSVTVPAADVASLATGAVTASVSDTAGNTGSASHNLTVDATVPVVTINTVALDDIINTLEHGQPQIISGSATGAAAGDAVVVTINGKNYTTVVDAAGNWSIGVPAADVAALADGTTTISVTVTNAAGNSGSATHDVDVDTAAPTITINTVTADDVINAAEQGADLVLSGATTNIEAGQTVSVMFNGKSYTATVAANGEWTLTVPAADLASITDGNARVDASVSNTAGNAASATHDYSVDSSAPVITINTLAADDILNATEAQADLVITGTTTAPAGQTVTVNIGGVDYTAQVQANGSWSVTVPAADVASLATGAVTASVSDTAGNTGSASHNLTVDVTVPVVTINTVALDDIINDTEHGLAKVVSGSATGVAAGDAVVVTINGKSYTTVVDAAGNWSIGVPAADVAALAEGTTTISVTVTNAAGNSGSATHDVEVDTAAPTITINTVTADDVINATEAGSDLVLSGATTNVEAGQTVTVTFNGKSYTATVAANGEWTLTVPAADLASLSDGNARVNVSVSNDAGNSASASHDYSVDVTAPAITINTIAADDILNGSEAQADLVITGTTTAPAGQTVTVNIGGVDYTAQVQANGTWSVTVPAADVASLATGTVTASVSDTAGNTGSASHNLTVDATGPVVTINTVAVDDIINTTEHGQIQLVSGSVTGAAAGDAVTVTVNGKDYLTVVDAAGNWSIGVPAADIAALADGTNTISVTVTNAAGNSGSATHNVEVDTAAPTITINTVTADDVINATEQGVNLVLSGATTNVEAGQTVTVVFNGKSYTATVAANGEWTLTVPAADLATLNDGNARVNVSVSNDAGNSASASHDYSVDVTAPVITINTIAADDILNATEAQADLVITGTTTAPAGQTVTVNIGGVDYTAQVQANGTWSVSVPAAAVGALSTGAVTASVSDTAGNTGSASHNLTVDGSTPVVTINTVAVDDIINTAEHGQTQIVSGSATGAAAGDAVVVTINGKNYTTVVDAAGNWSVGVPAADVAALAEGTTTISVTVTNAAGNSGSATHDVEVDTAAPTITINTVTADDVINATEAGSDLVLSGATTNVEAGQTVTVTFNGKSYTATVAANGEWTLTVPAADLASINDGNARVNVSVSNDAGNSASASHDYSVDTNAPAVTINTIAADDILNATEAQVDLIITGTTTAPAGQTVTVTIGGVDYTAQVQANGTWSVTVPAADVPAITSGAVTATVSDTAGNTGSASHNLTVDATVPVVTINTVALDDIINATEHGLAKVVSGSATGAAAGDAVHVTINGKDYTTVVDAAGNWSIGVPAADVAALAEGTTTVSVTVTNAAGNSGSATRDVDVDTAAPTITINTVTADDVINATEQGTDLVLSGATTNVEAGQTVTVMFNGKSYTATVAANGEWTLTVPAADLASLTDGNARVNVSVSNDAGNSASASHDYSVDTSAPAITINTIAADDILNATEAQADLVITGTTTAPAGQTVTVTIGGVDYTAQVQANGSWSITVPAADVASLATGAVTASVSDTAGNTGSASHNLTVDATVPVVTINTVALDDIINATEHGLAKVVSGSATGAAAGDAVVITINGKNYTTVVDAAGNWSVGVPAADVAALAEGTTTVSVTVTNAAGNSGSATHDVEVDTAAPTITINTVTADDVINAAEAGSDLVLSGATTGVEAGQTVTVMFNGKSYTATVAANGEWTLTVPSADLATLNDGNARVNVSVSNDAGNSASASHDYSVDTSAPAITINTIAADDILNATEAQADLVITGTTTAPAGQTVTVNIGGVDYTAQVQANGSWSVTVPAAAVGALNTGAVTASVSDTAGNTGSASHNLTVDNSTPVVTINTVASDDIINTTELGQTQIVSGSATGAAAGDAVTVTVNGKDYTTVVDAAGNWSVGVPAADVAALGNGTNTISVTVTNAAGNSGSATHDVTVDPALPSVSFDAISTDNVLNASEQGTDLLISGTSTGLAAGTTVTVQFNGHTYTATTDASGHWSLTVPSADLATLGQANYTLTADVTNDVGNSANATANLQVGSAAPVITIDTIATDDILNAAEALADLVITGTTTAPAGQTVTVTIGGVDYTAQVQANGTWSVTVPALDVASVATGVVTASVSDTAGNTGSTGHNLTVDATVPVVTINTVAVDDIINATEHGLTQIISGSATGVAAGDAVVVTINGKNYTTVVDASGNWSIGLPAADVAALADGTATISVTVTNVAGNSGSATHNVDVDTAAPTITINTVTADDVINATEAGADLVLSGATTNVEAGQTVTVMFNGKSYTATVAANGEWTLTVPAADLASLNDGNARVNVSVSNDAGNSASASHDYSADTSAPAITINTIAADDILNATEAQADLIISGTTTAPAGQTVTVNIGGVDYTAQVQANGTWSVTVPAADVPAITSGAVTATVSDTAGNTGSASHNLTVDATVPVVTINTVALDDIINATEYGLAKVVSGSATGAAAGDSVVVTINGKSYTTVVDAAGNWSIGVPAADVAALAEGTTTVSVTVTNAAGNSGSATRDVEVDTAAPTITINTVTADDVINAAEAGADLVLSGATTNVEAGQTVTVTFNGKSYTATVAANGEWTLTVPAADLASINDGNARVNVSVSNDAGNSASASHDYSVDTAAPAITINTIAADDILNATEAQADLIISGTTTAPAGQTVTVNIGGVDYTAQVQANGSWSVTVPAADVTSLATGAVTASVSDTAGNTGSASHNLTVDATVPVVTINTVALDDIINATEHGLAKVVSGSATGAAAGDAVHVTINGKDYTTVVDAAGNWSIGVPAADVAALAEGTTTVSVTVTNAAGNSGSANRDVEVDTAAPTITINTVTADDVINATEAGSDLVLSGATTNVEAGQTVTVMFNGKSYTATVAANGEWTLTVPAADLATLNDGNARVNVSVSNDAGNSASASHDYSVDVTAPVITINTIAADDILNATEAQADLIITGTTTAPAGQTVTVTIGGVDYTAQVQANGSWSVTVPAAAVGALSTGAVTATVSDTAGNTGSASHNLTVDSSTPVVTINTVAVDDIINTAEHGQTQIVSGSVTGAAAGDAVHVTINGKDYTTVVDAAGNWSVGVPAADVAALADGTTTISVTVTNAAGNSGSATHNVDVDTAAPTITINTVTADDVINAAEKGADLVLSGATSNVEAGQTVTVMFNGKSYTATVAANGEWTLTVPSADLASLSNGNARVNVSVSNDAGNSASASHDYSVDTSAPAITINTIAADDILNATEAQADLIISGTTTAPAGQTVTVNIGGVDYTAQVQANGSWSVTVPASAVASVATGAVTASVSDTAGNTGSASHNLTVDATAPVVTINTVASDDIINTTEHGQIQLVSGAVTGAAAGDIVTVTVNGKDYVTVVDAAGNWSVAVPAADVTALADGTNTISVTVTNAAGNSGSATHDVTVVTAAPAITINAVTADDVINAAEKGTDLVLSGATSNVEAGQTVTVMFNGKSYTATVAANGEWTLTVPAADLASITDGNARVDVSVSNTTGNVASATHDYSVDTTAPVITINTIAADDILNATEAQADLVITGSTTAPAGQTVTVNIGGVDYTAQVQANGSWSVTVPAAAVGALNTGAVTASVSDAAGNTGSASHNLTVDATVPVVTINPVASDDIINATEHGQTQIVSGSATGVAAGDSVVVTINGKDYLTVVDASGNWSVGVPAADVAALAEGNNTISVTVTNTAGNSGSATHNVDVETAVPTITINSVTADDVINAAEIAGSQVLSGNTTNVEPGQAVTVLFNGKSYTVNVDSTGHWLLVVPAADLVGMADGNARIEVSVSNAAGNSASATHDYSVDTSAPVLSINTVSVDDVLNAAEQQQPLTISGNTSAEAGQTVIVTINGTDYTAQVQANGTWSLTVPATDLAGLSEGSLVVTAVVADKAGNEVNATHNVTVDTTAPVITINTVAGDDIVNNGEQRAGQTISGTTTAEPGQTVTVSFNGHTYQATVDASGNWSVVVPANDFNGLVDGNYTITATVNDAAGNPGGTSHNVTLNGDVPTITINTVSMDDVINAAEHNAPLTLSGTTDAPAGQTVTITMGGKTYTAIVDANGQWSCIVSSADVAALVDGTAYVVEAQVSNTIGNSSNALHVVNVDVTAPAQTITIDAIQGDSGLNTSDFVINSNQVVLDGSLSAPLANGETAQISLDGGATWINLVVNGTTWTYADGRTLADGSYQYTVRVIDAAGNVGSVDNQAVRVDTTPPAVTLISVDSITQDTGLSGSDFITHDNQLALHGSLNAVLASGEHVQISLDGGITWIDVSVSGQSWSYADGRTLADGDYVYQLRVIDDAGNVSATANQTVTIDTQVPNASKTIAFDSITDDTGLSSSDFITKDTSLSLQGSLGATLAPGEIVQISLDGGVTWQNVTVIGTNWFFDDGRTLTEGTYDYWVRVIDTAGNVGETAHQQVTVDLTPPDSAIVVSIDGISTDTGYSSSDWLTNDTTLTVRGSISAPLATGDRVQISVDNGATWHDVVMNGNDWTYADSRTLTEGDHTYQVRVVDVAGNMGTVTDQTVTVDLTASTNVATIESYTDNVASTQGDFATGTTTDDRAPVLNGTLATALQTGELVRIYSADGTLLGEADVNGTSWTYQVDIPLVDGEKAEFYAVVVDAAGNEGAPSPMFDFTVDLVMYADTQRTLDTTPIVTGRVDFEIMPGEYVEVTINNVVYSSRNGAVVIDPKNSTWYVQLPDSDALALGTYDVKAVLYRADGTEITKDETSGELTVVATPEISFSATTASSEDTGTALTMSEDGTWRILSNSTVFTQNANDSTTLGSFSSVAISGPDDQQQSSFIDFDRDGLMDILGADTSYGNGQQSFKYNADGTYTSFQVGAYGVSGQTNDTNGNVYGWYGGAMGIDINGDGYVDMVYGDETPNDSESRGGYDSGFVINTDGTIAGFDKTGAYVYSGGSQDGTPATNTGNATPDREVSGVDLNNDGYVDITYHGTSGSNATSGGGSSTSSSRLVVVTNGVDSNGNMTLTNTQVVTDVFYGDSSATNYYTTMTWSDLNGDGYMDLFVGGLTGKGNATSAIFYNDGTGKLTTAANGVGAGSNVQTLGDSVNSMSSLAVDWNGDGKMDLIEIAGAAGSTTASNTSNIGVLWTNNGVNGSNQVNWSSQTLLTGANQGSDHYTTGALTLDLDYDGDKDLVVFRAEGGKTEYITNNSVINDGTSIILRISDANGINAFYGNTVLLIDESTGKVVGSQVINPQGGVNMNDSSGMVYFYGLDANKSYSAVLLANGQDYGGVSQVNFDSSGVANTIENVNASWGGLKAVEKNHAYTLTAEDGTSASNSATAATDGSNTIGIVGTGYNDTLHATAGTHIYNGGGGSRVVSDSDVWTAQGGMDIVDYKLAGSTSLNIDLNNTGMQSTGFGNAKFVNVEGIAGGNGDDVFTGNTGDNFFEGRGGNDTFNIGNGGQDTLLYKLINASDATGGNGSDVVNGFTIGTWEGTADTDRIDLRELLTGSGYTGSGTASYVDSVATLDAQAGNIEDYIKVVQNGSNTEIHVDRDGAGGNFSSTTVITLNGVQTDLATLLANHQLVVM